MKPILYFYLIATLCSFYVRGEENVVIPTTLRINKTYFVSPNGSDLNSGGVKAPWKTLDKVTKSLTAGGTAIFEDGV